MERKITNELLKWKRDSINKPLFLYGPRSVGKTYSVLEFGEKFYRNVAYFNLTNNPELESILDDKNLEKLVNKLSLLVGESIFKEDTLIVFDNCNSELLAKKLKIFSNDNSLYHVIIISSNRDMINKAKITDYYYRPMYAMDFEEYLQNTDKVQLIDFIKDSYETNKPMPFHQMAMDAYFDYLLTGGMPEVVYNKLNGASDNILDSIKQKILDVYKGEYLLFDVDNIKSNEIMDSLPQQLVKDNKKFQYGVIKKGGRSKEYENNINLLVTNGILNRSYRLTDVKSPLSSAKDLESFKLYFNDVGLLYTTLHLNNNKFMNNYDLRKTLVENNIANYLTNIGLSLYYYQSDGKAEVSFVIQNRNGKILPIEVVDMKLVKAKSLSLFMNKYNLSEAIRITEDNFSKKKGLKNIPLYAMFCIKDM